MKKFLIGVVCCFIMIFSACYAADVQVQVNGDVLNFADSNGNVVNPQIINSRTMVPFRKIFNSLNVADENITWIAETRTIKAKQGNVQIELQIGNDLAKKTVNGNTQSIKLDSAPVIVNNRTLVPLRFIAESLGKTVAWDGVNRTAIIIDYDYFLNSVKAKSNTLYVFLTNSSNNASVTITRKYFDLENSANNNEAIVNAQISETKNGDEILQDVNVTFGGSNDLMKEINSEGWGNLKYKNTYTKNGLITEAVSDGTKKIFGQEKKTITYDALNSEGRYNASAFDTFKKLCAIEESKINISTFASRKSEFSKLLSKFKLTNENGAVVLSTGNVSTDNISYNYFDFTKFDNIMWDDSVSRAYTFLNSKIFNYDVKLDELCYDMNTINCKIKMANSSNLTIDFVLSNEYNEKVEYVITINK